MTTNDPIRLTFDDMAAGFHPLGRCLQLAMALAAIQLGEKGDAYLDVMKKTFVENIRRDTGFDELEELAGQDDDTDADDLRKAAARLIGTLEQIVEGVRSSVQTFAAEEARR